MKIMRWLAGLFVFLFIFVAFLHGPPPAQAAVASSPTTCSDEHPWDKLKSAYRVQLLVITEDYLLLAVWYTRDQVQPVLIRIELQSPEHLAGSKSKTKYIVSD